MNLMSFVLNCDFYIYRHTQSLVALNISIYVRFFTIYIYIAYGNFMVILHSYCLIFSCWAPKWNMEEYNFLLPCSKQGWPTNQRTRTTFHTVLPQRITSCTWAHVNVTLSLPYSHVHIFALLDLL